MKKRNLVYIEAKTKRLLSETHSLIEEPPIKHEDEYIKFKSQEESMLDTLEHDQIGFLVNTETPYGTRPYVYADWSSTSRYCHSIEKPMGLFTNNLMNYHDNLKEQCRTFIHNHYRLDNDHKVIFGTSGPEECINKFVRVIEGSDFFKNKNNLVYAEAKENIIACKLCKKNYTDLLAFENHCSEECHKINLQKSESLNTNKKVLVILSPFEHSDNLVVFREFSKRHPLVELKHAKFLEGTTNIDLEDLSEMLESFEYYLVICCFTVCYNNTGEFINYSDVCERINESKSKNHTKEIIMCLDMTQNAPYSTFDKQSMKQVDVLFICPHMFYGGPNSSGLMIIKKHILCHKNPVDFQTGSAWFVSQNQHLYTTDAIKREENAKIENIMRSYLCHMLKEKHKDTIFTKIEWINNYIYTHLHKYSHKGKQYTTYIEMLKINKEFQLQKLPVYSFKIAIKNKENSTNIHPSYIASLLTDLFGIESTCITYDYYLSDLHNQNLTNRSEFSKFPALIPKYNKVSLHYSMSHSTIKYIVDAIKFITKYGIYYMYDYSMKGDLFVNKYYKNKESSNIFGQLKELNSLGIYNKSLNEVLNLNNKYVMKLRKKNLQKNDNNWPKYHELRWWVIPNELDKYSEKVTYDINQRINTRKELTENIESIDKEGINSSNINSKNIDSKVDVVDQTE